MVAKKRKKREIDIDDIIEARVQEEIAKALADKTPKALQPKLPKKSEPILCTNCRYWQQNAVQEGGILNGRCHATPLLPQRKATDWCIKGVRDER
ncbi:unnamed protein product [marine sediment metagenome]|uniref:Uncharacterized protein n=1 Tax=marine sediment metagenome TaxID=412755 RepID=X1AVP9_9ZZZZ